MSTLKAILWPNRTFRQLVAVSTPTAAELTREWVPAQPPPPPDGEVLVEILTVTDTQVIQSWSTRPMTADEKRYKIAPLTLLDRLARPELKAVVAMALGTTAEAVTDAQEGAWRMMLMLGATGEVYSDGRASLVLPGLFGAQRAAELIAPEPSSEPS